MTLERPQNMPLPQCNKFTDPRSNDCGQPRQCPAMQAISAMQLAKTRSRGPTFVRKQAVARGGKTRCPVQTAANVGELNETLQTVLREIDTAAALRGTVSWQQFNGGLQPTAAEQLTSQTMHAGAQVTLRQADFAFGTLRIRAPCKLVLQENVDFNPNANDNWFPTAAQRAEGALYAGDEYTLGFFASIAIETHHVMLDLNKFVLQQSEEHALQQRFFAIVELADQPFIPNQGPADFDDELLAAKQCVVRNGTLGRSSHHGMHGNGNVDLLIEDVVLRDYEVAAIALNGAHNAIIRRFKLQGSRTDVPVSAHYSAARFLMLFIDRAVAKTAGNANAAVIAARAALLNAQAVLQSEMDQAFQAIINGVGNIPTVFQLGNTEGVIDGNSYGILLNPLGVAVNGFAEKTARFDDPKASVSVLIEQGCIENTFGAVDEVVALWNNADKRLVVDTAGAQLQFARIVDQSDGKYVGTSLSNAQICLAKLVNLPQSGLQADKLFAVLYIPSDIVTWATTPAADIAPLITSNTYRYIRNGDSMAHVGKGVFGIKADGVAGLFIKCVKVNNTKNFAARAQETPLRGEVANCTCDGKDVVCYTGPTDGGHPAQGGLRGNTGNDVRGVSVAGCFGVSTNTLTIDGVASTFGSATGIDLFFETTNATVDGATISDVNAATEGCPCSSTVGCKVPIAAGLHTGSNTAAITINNATVEPSVTSSSGVASKAVFDSLDCLTVTK